MFHLEPIATTDELRVSIPTENGTKPEYVPANYNNFEAWIFRKYAHFLHRHGRQQYYWHHRYLLSPRSRKSEDLLFMMHVYIEHNGEPEDKYEKNFYKKLWRMYGIEFSYLIQAKIDQEKQGKGIPDVYAQAYYKKWLTPKTPNMKRLYHGVDSYEIIDLLETMRDINWKQFHRLKNYAKYQNLKIKNNKTNKK
jgi:hypothetical protein